MSGPEQSHRAAQHPGGENPLTSDVRAAGRSLRPGARHARRGIRWPFPRRTPEPTSTGTDIAVLQPLNTDQPEETLSTSDPRISSRYPHEPSSGEADVDVKTREASQEIPRYGNRLTSSLGKRWDARRENREVSTKPLVTLVPAGVLGLAAARYPEATGAVVEFVNSDIASNGLGIASVATVVATGVGLYSEARNERNNYIYDSDAATPPQEVFGMQNGLVTIINPAAKVYREHHPVRETLTDPSLEALMAAYESESRELRHVRETRLPSIVTMAGGTITAGVGYLELLLQQKGITVPHGALATGVVAGGLSTTAGLLAGKELFQGVFGSIAGQYVKETQELFAKAMKRIGRVSLAAIAADLAVTIADWRLGVKLPLDAFVPALTTVAGYKFWQAGRGTRKIEQNVKKTVKIIQGDDRLKSRLYKEYRAIIQALSEGDISNAERVRLQHELQILKLRGAPEQAVIDSLIYQTIEKDGKKHTVLVRNPKKNEAK